MAISVVKDYNRFTVEWQEHFTMSLPDMPSNRKAILVFLSALKDESRFALSAHYVIVQSPVNTAILKSCHDRYDSATYLSAVPKYATLFRLDNPIPVCYNILNMC